MRSKGKIKKSSRLRPFSDLLLKISDKGGLIIVTTAISLLGVYRWMGSKAETNDTGFLSLLSISFQAISVTVLIIVLFTLSVNVQLRKSSLKAIETELREAKDQLNEFGDNIENLFNGFLSGLSRRMGFDGATKARFSIYLNDDENSYFFPCGRYSPDPELQKKGRTKFAHEQGCIWKAWRDGFHFDNAAPEDKRRYLTYQKATYQIPKEELNELKMKPRLICGKRIEDPAGNSIGVIICEAIKEDLFTEDEVSAVLRQASYDLSKMLSSLQDFVPNPNDAGDIGL